MELHEFKNSKMLKGMTLRDEFRCPITYELMMDPVIAMDGNTYEKSAIDKWFKTNNTSPIHGGDIMEKIVIPNLNLKKLINDLILEGGKGLYMVDRYDNNRIIQLCHERYLTFKCLGPPESDFNMQSFHVSKYGCIGGRNTQLESTDRQCDIVIFKDPIVSRRHFEICLINDNENIFAIRDLGSSSGTFIRLKHGEKKELLPGMIILLGKHQFTISSIDEKENNCHMTSSMIKNSTTQQIVNDLIATKFEHDENIHDKVYNLVLNALSLENKLPKNNFYSDEKENSILKSSNILDDKDEISVQKPIKKIGCNKWCTLTCFSPDGSPFQGRSFIIGPDGTSLGRKTSNGISINFTDSDPSKKLQIDTAISAEHARIEMDSKTGKFYLHDGTITKPSTNGTWYRLSGPQQGSAMYQIEAGNEILIGNIRFEIAEALTIGEKDISHKK